jgi:hypothetical protein
MLQVQDRELVVAVLAQAVDFGSFDGQGAFVLVDAVPVEHAHFDDRARYAGGRRSGSVAHVRPSRRRWRAAASSGSSGSPFGVTLPTRMSPGS